MNYIKPILIILALALLIKYLILFSMENDSALVIPGWHTTIIDAPTISNLAAMISIIFNLLLGALYLFLKKTKA